MNDGDSTFKVFFCLELGLPLADFQRMVGTVVRVFVGEVGLKRREKESQSWPEAKVLCEDSFKIWPRRLGEVY